MNTRSVLSFLVVGLTVPLLTATPVQSQSSRPDTLRIAIPSVPTDRGNPFNSAVTPTIFTGSAIFDPLVLVNESGQLVAQLAREWRITEDRQVWRFSLRPNIRFQNGEPLTAQAFASAIEYLVKDEKGKTWRSAPDVVGVDSARAVDDLTLEVRTKAPDPILPKRLSQVLAPAPKAWMDLGFDKFVATPVGTGPYVVESWSREVVALAAHGGSWRATKIPRIEIVGLPEPATRAAALITNQIDVAGNLNFDDIKRIRDSGYTVVVGPAYQMLSLALSNVAKKDSPFNDRRVRQAANYAVNKQAIADGIFQGQTRVSAGQGASPGVVGFNPALQPYPQNAERAKALLAEAGFANGFKGVAEIAVGSFTGDSELYQQVGQDLARVGINLEMRQVVFADWQRKRLTNTWDGIVHNLSWFAEPYVDAARFWTAFSCLSRPVYACDEEIQKVIAASNQEFDPVRRERLLQEVMARYREDPPALYLVEAINTFGLAKRVRNFNRHHRWLIYNDMSLDG